MIGVFLAGGSGQRLWPRCRHSAPKQFHDLLGGGETLLQSTLGNVSPLIAPEDTWVVTGPDWADQVCSQLPDIPVSQILLEPEGRNTAAAAAFFLAHVPRAADNRVAAILPSDQWVADKGVLSRTLAAAARLALEDRLVLIGATPDQPHTGYGYIRTGEVLDFGGSMPAREVLSFQEKPDAAAAQAMVAAGDHLWNCGMFIARIGRLRTLFQELAPDILRAASLADSDPSAWMELGSVSMDVAISERASELAALPLRTAWTDLGTWDALGRILAKNRDENAVVGDNVVSIDSEQNVVCSNGRVIAMVGVKDLVIVDTPDALLVGHVDHMQSVKKVIAELESTGRNGVT